MSRPLVKFAGDDRVLRIERDPRGIEAHRLFQAGFDTMQIAERIGVHESTVYNLLIRERAIRFITGEP